MAAATLIRSTVVAAFVALVAAATPGAVAVADPAPPPGTGTATTFDGTPTVGAPACNRDSYVGGTSGSPWIAQTPLGPTVTGLIAGLHQGGCFSFTSYRPPLGLPALATYLRAVVGLRPDTAPVAGSDGCS